MVKKRADILWLEMEDFERPMARRALTAPSYFFTEAHSVESSQGYWWQLPRAWLYNVGIHVDRILMKLWEWKGAVEPKNAPPAIENE